MQTFSNYPFGSASERFRLAQRALLRADIAESLAYMPTHTVIAPARFARVQSYQRRFTRRAVTMLIGAFGIAFLALSFASIIGANICLMR